MASFFVKPFFFPYNPAGLELEKIKLECDRQHIDVSLLLLMRVETHRFVLQLQEKRTLPKRKQNTDTEPKKRGSFC